MRYSDFRKETLSCADAQFLIATALSFLGEHEASDSILKYLTTGNCKASESALVISQRKLFEEQIHEMMNCKAQDAKGVVTALIHYFCKNEVLESYGKESRVYSAKKFVTLQELLHITSIAALYEEVMKLCINRPSNEFILYYIDTEEYVECFKRDAQKYLSVSADNFRRNDLSDGVLSEVREDFKTFVYKYSTNNSYLTVSGTPIAFLRNSFAFYRKSSGQNNLYDILNKSGQDNSLSEDDKLTALDLVGIEENKESATINFISICSKICNASKLLFEHGDNATAFYDIFSYHRDQIIRTATQDKRNNIKNRIKGCNFIFNYDTTTYIEGDQNSINSKFAGRIPLCAILEDIVTVGLDKKSIYDFYIRILKKTDEQSVKNGVRLFSTSTHKTRHKESNGVMLRILIDGYLALRELLIFLDSKNNKYNVSVNNFPTLIFRDSRYLKRFKTMEEYITYVYDVSSLVNEVELDPNRRIKQVDGFYNNDTVYDIMSSKKLLNGDPFCTLRGMPLSYIKSAVDIIHDSEHDTDLYDKLQDIRKQIDFVKVRNLDAIQPGIFESDLKALQLLSALSIHILKTPVEDLRTFRNLHFCVEFCECLKYVMEREEVPVCDQLGSFLLEEELVRDQFDYLDEALESMRVNAQVFSFYSNNRKLRIQALHKIFEVYTGENKMIDFSCNREDLRNIFAVSTMLKLFFDKLCSTFMHVDIDIADIYLIFARLAQQSDMLCMPRNVQSVSEIAFLFDEGSPQYRFAKRDESISIQESLMKKHEMLINNYNNLTSQIDEIFEVFEKITVRIDQCMQTSGCLIKYDPKVEGLLDHINCSILGTDLSAYNNQINKARLVALGAHFDYLNFVEINNRRFSVDGRYFYHKEGVCVVLFRHSNDVEIREMTDADFNKITMVLNWGNGNGATIKL